MTGPLSSEWLKLRSTRSTHYALGTVLLSMLIGALMAWLWARSWDSMPPDRRGRLTDGSIEDNLLPLVQLCVGVLGVLSITGEYVGGLIRASLTVLPGRRRFLAAKAIVVGMVALVSGTIAVVFIHAASAFILGDRNFPGYGSFAEELPGLLGAGASTGLVALVGLGLGTILRSTPGALAVLVGIVLVLPMFANFLPSPWNERVASVLPPALSSELPLGAALLVGAMYLLLTLGGGALAIQRRDA